jgi:hypothetical protein
MAPAADRHQQLSGPGEFDSHDHVSLILASGDQRGSLVRDRIPDNARLVVVIVHRS